MELNLGNRFREIRKGNGMSQKEVAKLINIEQNALSKIENSHKQATIWEVVKFCDIMNISIDQFLMLQRTGLTDELVELIDAARKLNSEQIKKLKDFIKSL